MAPRDKYYTGSTVSRHLPAEDRSWDEVVGQSGKPFLDSEVNLQQEIGREITRRLYSETVPSGWLRGPGAFNPASDFSFPGSSDLNSFYMNRRTALVAGMPVVVEYTGTATANRNIIELEAATAFDGGSSSFKRTDFVFLEVWRALVSDDANSTGSIQLVDNASVAGTTLTIDASGLPTPGPVTVLTEGVDFLAGGSAAATIAALRPVVDALGDVTAYVDPSSSDTLIIQAALSGTPGNGIVISTGAPAVWTLSAMTTIPSDTPNKPTPDTIYRHGNVLADSSVNLPDEIADPVIGTETTKRVQVQYRIRTTGDAEGVNFATEADGFKNANVLAQGYDANASGVAGYPFVPADNTSTSANSDATAYGQVDDGLWIAGDGSSTAAAALGTVDGFVYAIPIAFVHRRNDGYDGVTYFGFDPAQNANGALSYSHGLLTNTHINKSIPANESDRPDGLFHDVIVPTDVQDLRRHVFPGGTDLSAELRRQMQLVLDGTLATWAIDGSDKQTIGDGTGDISTQFLVCNEVGRSSGGGTVSGDTTRGVTIGDFDHVRRRFGDHPVVERVVFEFDPSVLVGTDPGKHVVKAAGTGWYEGDVLTLDLSNLDISTIGDWDPAGSSWGGGQFTSVVPAGTQITNVLSMYHDDGNSGGAEDQTVKAKLIEGLGSDLLEITLDANHTEFTWSNASPPVVVAAHEAVGDAGVGDVGSQRRIFVEVEITYPIASGTTDTPDAEVTPDSAYDYGPLIENDTSQRPADFQTLIAPRFREGKREVALEYVANDSASSVPVTDYVISRDDETLVLPRRIFGTASGSFPSHLVTMTDIGDTNPRDLDITTTEYGSSSRVVKPDTGTTSPFSADQMAVEVNYFPQDPIPNYGGTGYQVSVYYRSNAPQTVGSRAGTPTIPSSVTVEPLVMAHDVWTGTVGSGSTDVPYPYTVPMDQIAINADALVDGVNVGEWYYAAQASISVDDFDAETGLLNLHAMVPTDGTSTFEFTSRDIDSEFRAHYKTSDPAAYRPTVFAQPFSGAVRHKVWMPFLIRTTSDETTYGLWRKNEVMLAVISRFAEFDDENTIRFTDAADEAAVALYRTRGLILLAGE